MIKQSLNIGSLLMNLNYNGYKINSLKPANRSKIPMPSQIQLKTMVLNNDPKLKKNFNCNSYTLLYNKINRCKYTVNVKVYYTFDRNKEDLLKRFLNYESTS